MILEALPSVGSGLLVGLTLGLIGGGGSILATPLLLYLVGVSPPHVAIGTSALAVSVNAFINFGYHLRSGNVSWACALVFGAIGTLGAIGGSSLGKATDGESLIALFAGLMLVIAVLMLKPGKPSIVKGPVVTLRNCILAAFLALLAGLASGFFGIGGGFLIVPALILATRMPIIEAIGSSLLAVGAFGLATAVNYSLSGLIDWRVAAEFLAGGILGGLLGTLLANRLSGYKNVLNRLFAGIIIVVACYMLYRNAGALLS